MDTIQYNNQTTNKPLPIKININQLHLSELYPEDHIYDDLMDCLHDSKIYDKLTKDDFEVLRAHCKFVRLTCFNHLKQIDAWEASQLKKQAVA